MNIQFEKISPVWGEITLTIVKDDYQDRVTKALKDYRKKAAMPGFRPGQVPMSLMQKRFGEQITFEQLEKFINEKLYEYIREEKIDMLGEPMISEKQAKMDSDADPVVTIFDIALTPQMDAKLSEADHIAWYDIKVDDEMVDRQVQAYAQRNGHYDQVTTWQEGDMTKGLIAELDEQGNTKEGGIQKEDAVILPGYFKDEDEKKKFAGVSVNTVITFNPAKAYNNSDVELSSLLGISKEQAAEVRGEFSYQINEITRYVPGALDQELFDAVLGKDAVKSEKEFRAAVKKQIEEQLAQDSQYRFITDVRQYLTDRIGQVEWPDELLKRIMTVKNSDKPEDYVEKNYEGSIKELQWHLIKEQLADQTGIKVEQEDVLELAKKQTRMQFAQYGMSNVPDELITKYATENLKKQEQVEGLVARCVEEKLGEKLQSVVTLDKKTVTLDEFNKLYETNK